MSLRLLLVLLLASSWLPHLAAQAVTATLVGTIRDTSGAVLAGVRVRVVNRATDAAREVTTDERGDYVVPSLVPGRYRVEATQASFQRAVVDGITLEMDAHARVDIRLEVGQVSEQITVQAAATFANTESAEIGRVVPEQTIKNLPLNGRNFLQLAKIVAGVTPSFGRLGTSEATSFSGGRKDLTMHVGGRGDSASFLVDGVEARSKVGGFVAVPISIDAVQEFNVKQNNFGAQYGFGEAIVSVTTKSGSNEIHGTLYEFLRNNKLDARNFFETEPKPFRFNQFGASIGGPIRRNKTFFFGNYEGSRTRREETFLVNVPNPQYMQGDFRGAAPVLDPGAGRTPFPDNVVPVSRVSRWARVFRDLYPAPNRTTSPNLLTTNGFRADQDQFTTRIDHNFSDKNFIYGRFIYSDDDLFTPEFVHLPTANTAPIRSRSFVLHDTHLFSPTWVSLFSFGYSWILRDTVREPFGRDLSQDLGVANSGQEVFRLPTNSILGYAGFGGVGFGFGERDRTYHAAMNNTVTRGAHTLNFGGEWRRNAVSSAVIQSTSGGVNFEGTFTGNSIADFLLGIPRSTSKASGVNTNDFVWPQLAMYFQDDWKVTPNFTLNLGGRWSYQSPIREVDGKTQTFDFSRGVLEISRPLSDGGVNFPVLGIEERYNAQPRVKHWKDFEPRFGFAFRPFGNDATVIRGGYGIVYTLTGFLEQRQSTTQEPPFFVLINQATSSPTSPELSTDRLWPTAADGLRTPGSVNLQAVFNPTDQNPYMQQWNFSIDQRVGSWLSEITYVGKAGRHIAIRHNVNEPVPSTEPNPGARRPYPAFGPILGRFQKQNTSYNALQGTLQRRFAQGFAFLGSYTWSHAIDIESREPSATPVQDQRNLLGSRSNAAYDVRHRFAGSGTYELPFGQGQKYLGTSNRFVSRLVGGWQVNAIVSVSTGNHFRPVVGQDIANIGAGFRAVRPDVLRDPNLPRGERTPQRWFDPSAFQLPAFGSFGNSGRNILVAPGQNITDLSLFKNNRIRENINLQFRAEFFNAFNHANFETPLNQIDGPNFGVITGADRPREIQFGIKLIY